MELEKPDVVKNSARGQRGVVSWLYGSRPGRMALRLLVSPWFSKAGGKLLQTRLSAFAVGTFVRANGIDLSECRKQKFQSFNDFFVRELKIGKRPTDQDCRAWISPCDARLTVYPVSMSGRFAVKGTPYTAAELLKNEKLAKRYDGGWLWLYRLSVDDYHRYIYPCSGMKSLNVQIPGIFHTVNPIAAQAEPIYKTNTREYCLIRTEELGTVLMMEVGAMLVGKIENREHGPAEVRRGQEKGNFAFGGSTIIVMSQAGCAMPQDEIRKNSQAGFETKVRMGETVGYRP